MKIPAADHDRAALEPSTTLLGDWYLTYLTWRPKHLVLAVSEHSRLAVLCPAAPIATLAPRLNRSVEAMLLACGV